MHVNYNSKTFEKIRSGKRRLLSRRYLLENRKGNNSNKRSSFPSPKRGRFYKFEHDLPNHLSENVYTTSVTRYPVKEALIHKSRANWNSEVTNEVEAEISNQQNSQETSACFSGSSNSINDLDLAFLQPKTCLDMTVDCKLKTRAENHDHESSFATQKLEVKLVATSPNELAHDHHCTQFISRKKASSAADLFFYEKETSCDDELENGRKLKESKSLSTITKSTLAMTSDDRGYHSGANTSPSSEQLVREVKQESLSKQRKTLDDPQSSTSSIDDAIDNYKASNLKFITNAKEKKIKPKKRWVIVHLLAAQSWSK